MPFLQLKIDPGAVGPAATEEACFALGALAVTLTDASDHPILEPAPGETPLWPEVRLQALWPALLGLLISHSISYYTNFVKKHKEQGRSMAKQMQEPYRRVIIMHMTLIFGGFLTLVLGTSVGALMLLLLLKILADMRSHIAQHSS